MRASDDHHPLYRARQRIGAACPRSSLVLTTPGKDRPETSADDTGKDRPETESCVMTTNDQRAQSPDADLARLADGSLPESRQAGCARR